MKASEIRQNLQKWYNSACWYGHVETPLGTLRESAIKDLAQKHKVALEYPYCS